jgi:hypothetical protein
LSGSNANWTNLLSQWYSLQNFSQYGQAIFARDKEITEDGFQIEKKTEDDFRIVYNNSLILN